MIFAFDLISDLHVETWDEFDWRGKSTSPVCVVAGDVSADHDRLFQTLQHLSQCYQAVMYIDGNTEHSLDWNDLAKNFQEINKICQMIPHVVYLQDNVLIMNGVAVLGTNGWWSWNYNTDIDIDQTKAWWQVKNLCHATVPDNIEQLALGDARYLASSISKLQRHQDVKHIVVVTHTPPSGDLICHDIDFEDNYRINVMSNQYIRECLAHDSENKVKLWCFGHYHGRVDRIVQGVRYINNCRGKGNTPYRQSVYHPLRLTLSV